ncbi:MAG: agmatinase [Phycisphaerae bacterium]|nr:agmatinase [Phycisphaerae bacterium]
MTEPGSNFGGLPPQYSELTNSKIVLTPVPYDGTSTWVKGADKGPEAIIRASANMELYDIETDSQVYLHGIATDAPVTEASSVERMVESVRKRVQGHLANDKFVVVLGGEHSVSIGAIQAHVRQFPGVSVLQLDAHSDLRQEYEGSRNNHACVMARARELCPIVQVGIRSMDISETQGLQRDRVFFAEHIYDGRAWIEQVVGKLAEQVYITIDLDVFDPSIMPSTGTPEPGGLRWYEVLALMKAVCSRRKVVGLDVVEMCPTPNQWAPEFLAAKLVYKILSYRFLGRIGG